MKGGNFKMTGEFFTLEYLGTFAGMVMAVTLIVGLTKNIFEFKTKWLALAVSFVVQYAYLFLVKKTLPTDLFLGLFNACLVTAAATGGYDFIFDKRKNTEQDNPSAEVPPDNVGEVVKSFEPEDSVNGVNSSGGQSSQK
jgi:hypothetical protein